jgi:DNA-binding response OmpR family regulator
MSKILLIEDDPVLGRSLSIKLDLAGYQNLWVQNLKEAEAHIDDPEFQLMLLDVGLPDGNGIEFLKTIRAHVQTPVIILTARVDEDAAVESLHGGATDFIRKPFGSRELEARIKKALSEPLNREQQLRVGEVTVFLDQRRVIYKNAEIELNRREFDFFRFLAQNLDRVVSRETLIASVGKSSDISDRTIDSHMSHIRTKLKDKGVEGLRIVPVYGVGYRMEKA